MWKISLTVEINMGFQISPTQSESRRDLKIVVVVVVVDDDGVRLKRQRNKLGNTVNPLQRLHVDHYPNVSLPRQ